MADILFRCSSCGKSLAVDSRCSGQSVNCTDCGCALVVPDADIEYRCPHCRTKLCSPADLAGAACSCPDCEKDLNVPTRTSRLSLGRKREDAPDLAGRRCPSCGSEVAPAAILCVNCGIDLRTGEPFHGKPKTKALNSVWFYWGTVAVMLVWHHSSAATIAEFTGSLNFVPMLFGHSLHDLDAFALCCGPGGLGPPRPAWRTRQQGQRHRLRTELSHK